MSGIFYRFSRCELHVGRRELLLDSIAQAVEPLPFDLLVMLVRHRHRHVSKDELMDALWPNEEVGPASLAVAIAKVRRSIGDSGGSSLIRTVRRVGYQFVGDVVEELDAPDTSVRTGWARSTGLSLALFPFENRTGDQTLDWISLGLMSAVCAELSDARGLAPVSVPLVVAAARRCSSEGDMAARANSMRQLTGADCIGHVTVQQGPDRLRLACQLFVACEGALVFCEEGQLEAQEPTALVRLLSRWIERVLVRGAELGSDATPRPDSWAQEVLARAMASCAERRWEQALALLAVVQDIEPRNVRARLEGLRAQATLREKQGHFGAALDIWRHAAAESAAAGKKRYEERADDRATIAAVQCSLWDEALWRANKRLDEARHVGDLTEVCRRAALLSLVHGVADRPMPQLQIPVASEPPPGFSEDACAAWWATDGQWQLQAGDHKAASNAFLRAGTLYAAEGATRRAGLQFIRASSSLLDLGRIEEARAALRRAEEQAENDWLLQRYLSAVGARVLRAHGLNVEADALLKPLLDSDIRDHAHADACAQMACWLAKLGSWQEALRMLAPIGSAFRRHSFVRAATDAVSRASAGRAESLT